MAYLTEDILNLLFRPDYMDFELSNHLESVSSQFQSFATKYQLHFKSFDMTKPIDWKHDDVYVFQDQFVDASNLKSKHVSIEHVKGIKITSIGPILKMTNLTYLQLEHFQLNNASFSVLLQLPKLTRLRVTSGECEENFSAAISENQVMEKLELTHLDLQAVQQILSLCQLEKLIGLKITINPIKEYLPLLENNLPLCSNLSDFLVRLSFVEYEYYILRVIDIVDSTPELMSHFSLSNDDFSGVNLEKLIQLIPYDRVLQTISQLYADFLSKDVYLPVLSIFEQLQQLCLCFVEIPVDSNTIFEMMPKLQSLVVRSLNFYHEPDDVSTANWYGNARCYVKRSVDTYVCSKFVSISPTIFKINIWLSRRHYSHQNFISNLGQYYVFILGWIGIRTVWKFSQFSVWILSCRHI